VKPVKEMSRLELAGFVCSRLRQQGIDVVLSGGSCVSIYSQEKYVSQDLDFVTVTYPRRDRIRTVMESLGFFVENRCFRHPESKLLAEFPPGPLGVGEERVKRIDEIETESGVLRILSPTDCVKDRLAWYYHDKDLECLGQAVLVANSVEVDIEEIERWSAVEGKSREFREIRERLRRKRP